MAPRELSSPEDIQKALTGGIPRGRWQEGLLFRGIYPTPGIKSAANWFPRTEEVGPDELRITFMGTAPMIRPGQMNTSIFIELGNGDNFIFDLGEGSVANYLAAGLALNQLDKIFITHLHIDHYGALPWLYMFGGWAGRWHKPLRVFGASGRSPEYGTGHMVEGMKQMLTWHRDAFSVFPVGSGHDIEVTEFDFRDNGGTVYDENGVKVIHWQRSHAKDGASAYRLDWNGLSVVWTGDGRPSLLDAEYAAGADVYITETQPELVEISSGVQGVPPFLGRYTLDTHHTPAHAAGYVAKRANPRLFMTTHMRTTSTSTQRRSPRFASTGKARTIRVPRTVSWSTSPRTTSGYVRAFFPTTPTAERRSSTSTTASSSSPTRRPGAKRSRNRSSASRRSRPRSTTRRALCPPIFSSNGLSPKTLWCRWKRCPRR